MADSVFTRKLGPLPVWAYMGIVLVALALWRWIASKKSAKAAGTSTEDTGTSDTTGTDTASTVPDFISQNYVNTTVNNLPPTGPTTPTLPTSPPPKGGPVVTPKPPASKPPTAKPKVITYTVKKGDTLSSIAKKYHTTVDAIWNYNTKSGNRPAATIATLKKRGKNLIFSNEKFQIVVPQ